MRIASDKVGEKEITILWHTLWRNWRDYKLKLYRLFNVDNIEDFIKKILSSQEYQDKLLDFMVKYVKPTVIERGDYARMINEDIHLIPFTSKYYPQELLRMNKITEYIYPPLVLYHKGEFLDLNSKLAIAIVGTRKCTEKGFDMAIEIGRLIARRGFILVTGFARGIDFGATKGALEEGGTVVEVRPWMDYDTIGYGKELVLEILKNGCFISENLSKIDRIKWIRMMFQLRNRIIAGMSKIVIIVEARPKGGSMHQIEYAIKRNKPVLIWKPNVKDEEILKAYRIYRRRGATPFNDISDLDEKIRKILLNNSSP